jgi:beta-phosphoglucomutase
MDIHNISYFILSDLDGTLIDTDNIHYEAYKPVLEKYNIFITWDKFYKIISTYNIDKYLLNKNITKEDLILIKKEKNKNMLRYINIKYVPGAKEFLLHCINKNINIVIVTNTSREIVEHFKMCLPLLNKISNWICKEDYKNPKPSSECYNKAYKMYYNNEDIIIGIENTINGINSLKNITNNIYYITNNLDYNMNNVKAVNTLLNIKL